MTEDRESALQMARQIVEQSVDGALAFDHDGRYLLWNRAMERLSGLSAEEVIGQRATELFPFLLEIGEDAFFRQALAGERVVSRERGYFIEATGKRGYFEGHYGPLRGADGRIVGALGIIRDVTERRIAEARIREIEGRFRMMADVAPVLLWMAEPDGLRTFFNQTWLDFTGRTLADEWGLGWAEGVHFEDLQRCVDAFTDAFNERRVFEVEYQLRRADGAYRWVLDRGAPRYQLDGTFAGFIGSCIDITDRKHVESDLRDAVKARDEFLSIASHELRTPLTPLQLQIDSLVRAIDRDGDDALQTGRLREKAVAVQQQALRLGDLVRVLLDVSRITEGRLDLDLEDLDLTALVRQTCDRFRVVAGRAGCELAFTAPGPVRGRWDRVRLEQVTANLVSNAIKYGAGKPIAVAIESGDEVVRLRVRDRGIGIAEGDQRRIFHRFERGVSARHYGGFGLGLWISTKVTEALRGSIRVESAPGEGSTFVVELPLDPTRAPARADARGPTRPGS